MIIWSKKKKKISTRNNQTINFRKNYKLKVTSFQASKINFCLPHISNEQIQIAIFFLVLSSSIHFYSFPVSSSFLIFIIAVSFIFEQSKYIRHKIPQLNRTMDNRKFTVSRVHSSAIQIYFPCRPRVSPGPRWSVVTTWPYPRVHFDVRSGCSAGLNRNSFESRAIRDRSSPTSVQCTQVKFIHCSRIRLIFLYTARFVLFDFFIHLSRESQYLSMARDNRVTNGIKLLRSLDFSNDALQL